MNVKSVIFLIAIIFSSSLYAQENCNNGIDDDFDGLIDLKDTLNCSCKTQNNILPNSLIPNYSFEDMSCCPRSHGLMSCATYWEQASEATSDYFNTCGLQYLYYLTGHNKPAQPLPFGEGYVGFFDSYYSPDKYKEYIGTCLPNELDSGVDYELKFVIANSLGLKNTTIAIFGSKNCNNLPYKGFGCPTYNNNTNWELLDTINLTLVSNFWKQGIFSFKPKHDINAIAIGPSCGNPSTQNSVSYYYMDNLVLNTKQSFNPLVNIVSSGSLCKNNYVLKAICNAMPTSFQWYKDSVALIGETNNTLNITSGNRGNYQVKLSYNMGCIVSIPFNVSYPKINFEIEKYPNCKTSDIKVKNVKGGKSPYLYKLETGVFQKDSMYYNLATNNYILYVKDSNDCIKTDSFKIQNLDTLILKLNNDTAICKGDSIILKPNASIKNSQYIWYDHTTDSFKNINKKGKYWLDATNGNCKTTDTVNISFDSIPPLYLGRDTMVCHNSIFTLKANNIYEKYIWNDNSTHSELIITNYGKYWLTVSNRKCFAADTINIILKECNCLLNIPNAFSPNRDGINETFKPIYNCNFKLYNMQIFNRWGEKIFESNNPLNVWDGKYKDIDCQEGIYTYSFYYLHGNVRINEKGSFTLLK